MKKICLVTHLCAINHWQDWFMCFINQIEKSGLLNSDFFLKITIQGKIEDKRFVELWLRRIKSASMEYDITLVELNDDDPTEYLSLLNVSEEVLSRKFAAVGYVHSKGVSYSKNVDPLLSYKMRDWANALMVLIVAQSRRCIDILESDSSINLVGANFENFPEPHFSGNMFWASGKTNFLPLLHPNCLQKDPNDRKKKWRLYYEFWACSGPTPRIIAEIGRTHVRGMIGFHYRDFTAHGFPKVEAKKYTIYLEK